MSVAALGSSRGLIGSFFMRLEEGLNQTWIPKISMEFQSNQEAETYRWIGSSPYMREWKGGRQAKGLWDNSISIVNKRFEATIQIPVADFRRDSTGQSLVRINELADQPNEHWGEMLSSAISAGASTVCYDGQYFYDIDHVEGNNTTSQSNDLSIDISELPGAVHGSTTNPSSQEMQQVIMSCIEAIYGFKNNENKPMNRQARSFLVMVPIPLYKSAISAVYDTTFGGGETNTIKNAKFNIEVVANPDLAWTEQITVFRTDGTVKPFIRQSEKPVELKVQAEGSQIEFEEDMWRFGVDCSRNVGYGYWQHACLATMV
jgi:phage major head subunit gpT-like protein